ncbi:MAG TPA: hypothetical protein VFB45_14585 [Pseudolabrys sp.]|nr:hypothetical protein [Pseudolabrys sp.]
MIHRSLPYLVAGCALAFAIGGCSSSQYTNLTVPQCVAEAKLALRDADFTQNLEVTGVGDDRAVSGEHGSYRGSVYCVPGKRTVEVTGLDLAMAQFYKKSIIKRF